MPKKHGADFESDSDATKRIADTNPPQRSKEQDRNTNSDESLVFHSAVVCTVQEFTPKFCSELALFSLGKYFWESRELSLEDYMRMEFLLHRLSGDKKLVDIVDPLRWSLSGTIAMVLKYARRSFEPFREYHEAEFLFQMAFAKFGIRDTLEHRYHKSRASTWRTRYELWLDIRSTREDHVNNRGVRYSSYTKGYHDGSALRPTKPQNFQTLDRASYSRSKRRRPDLDVWDPKEFRENL